MPQQASRDAAGTRDIRRRGCRQYFRCWTSAADDEVASGRQ